MAIPTALTNISTTTRMGLIAQIQADRPPCKVNRLLSRMLLTQHAVPPEEPQRLQDRLVLLPLLPEEGLARAQAYLPAGPGQSPRMQVQYFADLHETDVMLLLRDSYRLRVEADFDRCGWKRGVHYDGSPLPDGVIYANGGPKADFRKFLDLAEGADILPEWWDVRTKVACIS